MKVNTHLGSTLLPHVYLFSTIVTIMASGSADVQKRDQACGALNGYPNALPPTCTGAASMCTFSGGRQGCCDNSGHCAFYTSCNGGLAPTPCTDASCLQCPKATPYCARYALGPYEGFGCGIVDMGNSIIYGVASTGPATVTATSTTSIGSTFTTSSRSQTSSSTVLSSPLLSPTPFSSILSSSLAPLSSTVHSSTLTASTPSTSMSSSSATTSKTKTSSAATYTGTSIASLQNSKSQSLSGGVIAGIVVGVILGILLICLVVWLPCRKRRPKNEFGRRPQLQQGYTKPMSTFSD